MGHVLGAVTVLVTVCVTVTVLRRSFSTPSNPTARRDALGRDSECACNNSENGAQHRETDDLSSKSGGRRGVANDGEILPAGVVAFMGERYARDRHALSKCQ